MTQPFPAYFHLDDDGHFVGNDPARGPWAEHSCHGGPVSAVIARELENLIAGKSLTRLTVDLLRPVPVDGFTIEARAVREGRRVSTGTASLRDRQGRCCAMATSMHLGDENFGELPTHTLPAPDLSQASAGEFPIQGADFAVKHFGHFLDIAYPPGEDPSPGATTLWMRSPQILEGEKSSPFQSLCPLADCGNALSRHLEITELVFMNSDLTIVMHRPPRSDWLASSAHSFWETNGVGVSRATLFDTEGAVATALQTLVLMPRN